MMPNSLKALDLRRDPRFALQANPGEGTGMGGGDVRVSGRAFEVTDPEVKAAYTKEVEPPEQFHLFRTELTEVTRTYVEDDKYLVLQVWKPGAPLRTIKRT
ncbi:Pyridoxamine 5'-phosphate oxidase putative domain-containing protein OS=Streptomyces glaucescens OX=1907 GN=SGLAU_20565 PE=4 SV=1 [Streptomyces glaucescens]